MGSNRIPCIVYAYILVFIFLLCALPVVCRHQLFLNNQFWSVRQVRTTVRWTLYVYSLAGPILYCYQSAWMFTYAEGDFSSMIHTLRVISVVVAMIGSVSGLFATYVAICLALNCNFTKWRPAFL